jgi:hypothetical protein
VENRRDKAVIGVCDATLSELRRTDRHPVPMHSMTVREAFRRVGADEWDAVSERVFPQGFPALREVAAVVDDAAHGIWAGGNKEGPLTDLEWVEMRMNTYQLQAAATLVSIGGTGPADRGWATSPGFQERARKLSGQRAKCRHCQGPDGPAYYGRHIGGCVQRLPHGVQTQHSHRGHIPQTWARLLTISEELLCTGTLHGLSQ